MAAYFTAPALCQGADEDVIIEIASIVFPGFVDRTENVNGLHLTVEGDYRDRSLAGIATACFQILLGILRAWRYDAGQRADETRPGIGAGPIRDDDGNQIVTPVPVISYPLVGSEVKDYARKAKIALENSEYLRKALWLNGQRDRTAAEFYMIYEYAEKEFAGLEGIAENLGVSKNSIKSLRNSANNVAPMEGGRHVSENHPAKWNVDAQKKFIATFLKKWIEDRARC